ncbi:HicB family protein [Candidatus Peregrinibacteria bacterium]|nr:MAG: HicB family protein [Candidatus Peregrinibacteria bacterium]
MKQVPINIIVWKEGKYYVSQCLNTHVSSFGDTKEDALLNIQEALELYFDDNENIEYVKIEQPEIVSSTLTYA